MPAYDDASHRQKAHRKGAVGEKADALFFAYLGEAHVKGSACQAAKTSTDESESISPGVLQSTRIEITCMRSGWMRSAELRGSWLCGGSMGITGFWVHSQQCTWMALNRGGWMHGSVLQAIYWKGG